MTISKSNSRHVFLAVYVAYGGNACMITTYCHPKDFLDTFSVGLSPSLPFDEKLFSSSSWLSSWKSAEYWFIKEYTILILDAPHYGIIIILQSKEKRSRSNDNSTSWLYWCRWQGRWCRILQENRKSQWLTLRRARYPFFRAITRVIIQL